MKNLFFIGVVMIAFMASCKKENATAENTQTPPPVDQRDKFVGTWAGTYYIDIPNIPVGSPLENLPDSVPTTITITKNTTNAAEIQIAITNSLTGNRTAKAFVNGNRYFYEPFNANIAIVNVSFKGDGLLNADGLGITEEGFLKTTAVNIPPIGPIPGINIPSLIGVWSSKLKKR
jgi:hypothetical protein